MLIVFSRSLRVEAKDGINFTVQSKKVAQSGKNKGQVYWINIGHHGSLDMAARQILQQSMLDADIKVTALKLTTMLDKIARTITKACELAGSAQEAARLKDVEVNADTMEDLFDATG